MQSQSLPFPASPGADELSVAIRRRLLDDAFTLVEKRARPAATTYLLVFAVVGFATPYPRDHPRVFWGLVAMYACLAVLRAVLFAELRRRQWPPDNARWWLFAVPMSISAASWSAYSGYTLVQYGDSWLTLVFYMLIGFGALSTVLNYAPMRGLSLLYCAALILPAAVAALISHTDSGSLLVLLSLLFAIMNVPVILRLYREYWQGVISTALLEQRASEFERAKLSAERASHAKSEFLASVSHELRTPMSGVLGVVGLLRDTPLSPEQQEYSDIIHRSSRSLLVLIDDLLDAARIEAGRIRLTKERCDPKAIAEDVVHLFRPMAEQRGVTLSVEVAPSIPQTLLGDAGRLRQVLQNLVSNAVKFTAEGEVWVVLRLFEDSFWSIEVSDTGIGIPEERQHRLFQRYEQGDESIFRRYGGSGLGLAIVQELVLLMRGTIALRSSPGVGTAITVTLPLERPPNVAIEASSPPPSTQMRHNNDKPRALLVDDDPVNRKVAAMLLTVLGYHVDEAADGKAALARFQAGRYNLVLMDCQMPEMDGFEATQAMRSVDDASSPVPILALTANTDPEVRRRCFAAGMDEVLLKPVTTEALRASLRALGLGRNSRREGLPSPSPAQGGEEPCSLTTA